MQNWFWLVCFFHPPTSLNCTIFGIQTPRRWHNVVNICILKRGADKWESNEYRIKTKFRVSYGAPVLHREQVYFLDVKGNVATFDISKSRLIVNSRCLRRRRRLGDKIKEHYLFKIKGEEQTLFAVFVLHDERKVNMFRLLEPEMKWELVEDIGDKVLYLSLWLSFGDTAHLKSMANRIYFPKFHGDTAIFYSLCTRKYHSLDNNYSDDNSYGLKRLDFAAWIMPAPIPQLPTELLTWSLED
ncbi:hypothetical protein DH2020_047488 [Rehmannia glutinosa]|uniref:KIB1-4 beta-propeller domain-containing protein n=1 Tax=Rehmannia glutinosa TaxID=99300 RepID=A0ABR0U897_REHGL